MADPGNDRARPGQDAPQMVTTTNVRRVPPTADNLWRSAERCPNDAIKWLSLGWRLGLLDGRDEGWRMAQIDAAVRWHEMWLSTREVLRRPSIAELQRRRGEVAR